MTTWQLVVLVVSEAIALYLIGRIWRSEMHLILKLPLSVVALIPVAGPFLAYWISNIPSPQHPSLQSRSRRRADVFDRWRGALDETDDRRRIEKMKEVVDREDDRS